ncbi:MAG: hypothetical protein AAFV26_00120 [Pseudomonadota bacterium]
MLARLVLIVIQAGLSIRLAPEIRRFLTVDLQGFDIFVYALIFGVLVWLVGVLGHLILKDVAQPTPSTLAFSIGTALVFAGLTLIPDLTEAVGRVIKLDAYYYPLVGAVLGYAVKK